MDRESLPQLSERIFCDGGYAAVLPNFEHRPEQEKMALYCAQAFASDSPLLFEAGTGVGKSLAYLVPGIIAAVRFKRQLVVATHTIALQQQIIEKDIPRIRELFSACKALEDCANFKEAILLGRANYLCTHRLKRALAEKRELFDTEESAQLESIADWATHTKTGLFEELPYGISTEVWNWVNADSSSCSQKNCSDGTCFYRNARAKAASAQIVILNHSLLFSLLAGGGGTDPDCRGILFPDDMLVLDEAHLVPDVASECFGISLSAGGVSTELKRIYDPRKKRGLITREGLSEFRDREIVAEAILSCEKFFSDAQKRYLEERKTVRLSSPDWISTDAPQKLDSLIRLLDSLSQNAKSESLAAEIKDHRRRVSGIKNSMEDCLYISDNDYVYWLESDSISGHKINVNSAPIEVADKLRKTIFSKETGVVLTSATLAVGGDMEDFSSKIGADGAESCICDSPFDYDNNMRVLLNVDSPEPDKNSRKLDCRSLAKNVEALCARERGGTLVLFTSHSDLRATAEILENSEILRGRNIYVQGRGRRSELIKNFAEDGNSILLGTDTFWTGIDVPGPALSQIIITRLPFENFTHPLIEARMERAESLGQNAFTKISLPSAIIKFRQGIGRLIRSSTDKGTVAILDSRIISKGYGKNFVAAIPSRNRERFSSSEFDKKSSLKNRNSHTTGDWEEEDFPF